LAALALREGHPARDFVTPKSEAASATDERGSRPRPARENFVIHNELAARRARASAARATRRVLTLTQAPKVFALRFENQTIHSCPENGG
jgi:hypothetical protein